MESPRTNPGLSTKSKLKFATFSLMALLAYSCSSNSQDIVSGILTDWENRREAEARWLEYQNYEHGTDNPVDIYELRKLQAEAWKESDELTRSRDRWIRNLWRAERRNNREDHRNSVSGNEDRTDPLKWKNRNWDPTMGQSTDDALRDIYFNN